MSEKTLEQAFTEIELLKQTISELSKKVAEVESNTKGKNLLKELNNAQRTMR